MRSPTIPTTTRAAVEVEEGAERGAVSALVVAVKVVVREMLLMMAAVPIPARRLLRCETGRFIEQLKGYIVECPG